MNRVRAPLGRLPLLALLAASAAACASGPAGPAWTFGARAAVSVDTIDGYTLGPARTLDVEQFHRLEATARALWREKHPNETLSGFEVRMPAGAAPTATNATPAGPDDYLVVVTAAGGKQHVIALHCNPLTFPAPGSCS
jgi:hypothetical protein